MRARLRRWGDPLAGAIAAGLCIAIVLGGEAREGPVWANVAIFLLFGVLLAFRSRAPAATTIAFGAVLVVLSAALTPPPEIVAIFTGLLLFAYGVGTQVRGAWARVAMSSLVTGIIAANLSVESTVGDYIFPTAITVAAFLAGRDQARRGALAAELHETALRAEEAQAALAARAVAAERRRIARELHDVVAHSISVMVVQAGGARRVLEHDPQRAEQAAAQIERTGRETLTEMRRLLGVMHGGTEPAALEPTPTLADLEALCARVGATLHVDGDAREVGAGLQVGAYRVVQEALGDPAAGAAVELRWSDAALDLRITGADRDLPGVRERVDLYDGEAHTDGAGDLVVSFPLTPEGAPT